MPPNAPDAQASLPSSTASGEAVTKYTAPMPNGATQIKLPAGNNAVAGSLGARYDRRLRTWWLPRGANLCGFRQAVQSSGGLVVQLTGTTTAPSAAQQAYTGIVCTPPPATAAGDDAGTGGAIYGRPGDDNTRGRVTTRTPATAARDDAGAGGAIYGRPGDDNTRGRVTTKTSMAIRPTTRPTRGRVTTVAGPEPGGGVSFSSSPGDSEPTPAPREDADLTQTTLVVIDAVSTMATAAATLMAWLLRDIARRTRDPHKNPITTVAIAMLFGLVTYMYLAISIGVGGDLAAATGIGAAVLGHITLRDGAHAAARALARLLATCAEKYVTVSTVVMLALLARHAASASAVRSDAAAGPLLGVSVLAHGGAGGYLSYAPLWAIEAHVPTCVSGASGMCYSLTWFNDTELLERHEAPLESSMPPSPPPSPPPPPLPPSGTNKTRDVVIVRATAYIDSMHERYCDGDAANSSQRFPASWSHTPADDELVRAYEAASETRAPAESKLFAEYNSLVGSLRHAVKYRPGIAAAMDLLDCCLTSPTEQLLRCAYRVLVYLVRTRRMGTCYSGRGDGAAKITASAGVRGPGLLEGRV